MISDERKLFKDVWTLILVTITTKRKSKKIVRVVFVINEEGKKKQKPRCPSLRGPRSISQHRWCQFSECCANKRLHPLHLWGRPALHSLYSRYEIHLSAEVFAQKLYKHSYTMQIVVLCNRRPSCYGSNATVFTALNLSVVPPNHACRQRQTATSSNWSSCCQFKTLVQFLLLVNRLNHWYIWEERFKYSTEFLNFLSPLVLHLGLLEPISPALRRPLIFRESPCSRQFPRTQIIIRVFKKQVHLRTSLYRQEWRKKTLIKCDYYLKPDQLRLIVFVFLSASTLILTRADNREQKSTPLLCNYLIITLSNDNRVQSKHKHERISGENGSSCQEGRRNSCPSLEQWKPAGKRLRLIH